MVKFTILLGQGVVDAFSPAVHCENVQWLDKIMTEKLKEMITRQYLANPHHSVKTLKCIVLEGIRELCNDLLLR